MNPVAAPFSTRKKLSTEPEKLKSWLPVDAIIEGGQPAIEWMDLGDVEFREPFFNETLVRANAIRKRPTVVTELDALLQLEKISDSLEPSGFIFHSSRCGSTLLANACRALSRSIVIAEAPVLDKIASRFFTDAERDSPKELPYKLFLRAAVSALGQRRCGDEQHYFVKFACTTTLQMNRIRNIWPDVPFIFLYRDPVEVIVSNLKTIPEWMLPESNPATAAAIVGVSENEVSKLSPEEFCARALGRFFATAQSNRSDRTKFINYPALTPETIIEAVEFFGVVSVAEEVDAIRRVSRLYSKDLTGRQTFASDTDSKRASASNDVIKAANQWAQAEYERLSGPA
jgi:hypothetical protein